MSATTRDLIGKTWTADPLDGFGPMVRRRCVRLGDVTGRFLIFRSATDARINPDAAYRRESDGTVFSAYDRHKTHPIPESLLDPETAVMVEEFV